MANTSVTGRVVFAEPPNDGIQGVLVVAVDIDPIGEDDVLGADITDANGDFSISYDTSDYRIWGAVGESPDIEVRIFGDGDRLLWETPIANDVDVSVLNVGTISISRNNFRVPDLTSTPQQRRQDPYWLVTHTSLDPANAAPIRLTRGNQIDWLVDGALFFPEVTDHVTNAANSIKIMNMAFDAKDLISSFDFGPKNHQTVEAGDLVIVRRLGQLLTQRAAGGLPVEVLMWELEDNIGGGVGDLFNKADGADEFRKFFENSAVRVATLKTTQLLHVKLILIDGTIGYITGSTLKQGYFCDQDHLLRDGRQGVVNPSSNKGERQLIHDVSLRVQGPSTRHLDETFSTIWNAANQPAPAPAPQAGPIGGPDAAAAVQVLRTLPGGMFTTATPDPNVENVPHGETGILESYQRAILKAEEFIYIEDQYFNSKEVVEAILQRMIEKPALEVILVLNSRPDIGGYHSHQTSLINQLIEATGNQPDRVGVFTMWSTDSSQQRFEVAHVYMHSKVAIVDDLWASVGTANVDGASLNYRQWRLILPGMLEVIGDFDDLELAMLLLWFPIIFLVLLVTSPVLLLLPDIGPFLVDTIKKEFARASQHAVPNRPQQPLRHCEINISVYNDIAGQPPTDKVKELRESLWTEMIGGPLPATRPADGWVKHWKHRADDLIATIRNASADPPVIVPSTAKVLEWVPDREYDSYLRSLQVNTKNIRLRSKGVTMPFDVV
jgi:phosphatidylserine/phosphatidylglycerophosphate/cardiolipin synthase-like enzyme